MKLEELTLGNIIEGNDAQYKVVSNFSEDEKIYIELIKIENL